MCDPKRNLMILAGSFSRGQVKSPKLEAARNTESPTAGSDSGAWLAWRMEQATPESRLKGEVALFWHPQARNAAKM